MKQILFSECIPNFLLYECFAMHMMTCQILVLGQNTRGVTATGTPTREHHPSNLGCPLETLHMHYLLPIRDFH